MSGPGPGRGTRVPRGAGSRPDAGKKNAAPASARETALDVLLKVESQDAYSNLLLNAALKQANLSREDAGLTTELVYGTLSRMNTLDYVLGQFVAKGVGKLQPWVRALLRLSLYQIMYLDRIPSHAAVSEAVNIAKRRGHQGVSGLVNGVLRSTLRAGELPALPAGLPEAERIALQHSHPQWLVERWITQYGAEAAEAMAAADNEPPAVSLRVNRTMTTRDALLEELNRNGVEAVPSPVSPSGILVKGGGNMALTSWYEDGLLSVQDESSMLVAEAVDPQPGMKVLDCCAAPGGKSAHLGELMKDEGLIVANDLHPHKAKLVAAQAARLGLESIRTETGDALELGNRFAPESFDRILLDAPCSGLGVIRRKPDLKWRKTPGDIYEIAGLQRKLLDTVSELLAPGGRLVYSTCTTETAENAGVVEDFLAGHPEFRAVTFDTPLWKRLEGSALHAGCGLQILPHHFGSDGFFITVLERAGNMTP